MNIEKMQSNAQKVSGLMKSISHEGRLMTLCQLADGEKSVGEIARALGVRDSAASQQLALLRKDKIVEARRDAQVVYYSLVADDVLNLIEFLYGQYCCDEDN